MHATATDSYPKDRHFKARSFHHPPPSTPHIIEVSHANNDENKDVSELNYNITIFTSYSFSTFIAYLICWIYSPEGDFKRSVYADDNWFFQCTDAVPTCKIYTPLLLKSHSPSISLEQF